MAKRFTDTEKWKKRWFRELGSELRDIRQFILDDCDHAGIWDVDLDRLKDMTGVDATLEDIQKAFKGEVTELRGERLYFPAFIEFQYGKLNPANKAHWSIIAKLEKLGILPEDRKPPRQPSPSVSPSQGGSEGAKEKEKEMEKEKDSSPAITNATPPSKSALSREVLAPCCEAWGQTLESFRIRKDPWMDAPQIGQLIQRHGAERTRLALLGAAREEKTDRFDPAKHCGLARVIKHFDKFVNLGAQDAPRMKGGYEFVEPPKAGTR